MFEDSETEEVLTSKMKKNIWDLRFRIRIQKNCCLLLFNVYSVLFLGLKSI